MIKLLPLTLVFSFAVAFAQTAPILPLGLSDPPSARPEAGDVAPDLTFTKVLSTPTGAPWATSNFFGQITVIGFFGGIYTSANPQMVERWNRLVDQFAGKPVQFIWITDEQESSLVPFLAQHPLKGYVLLDPDNTTARAFGIELREPAIIGTDGRIIGFVDASGFIPNPSTIDAALEGRITTTPLTPAGQRQRQQLHLLTQASHIALPAKPAFPPSYVVHVSLSQEDRKWQYGENDFVVLQDYDLKEVLRKIYMLDPIRFEIPAALDNGERYDFAMVLPDSENMQQMDERLRQGVLDHFNLTATHESRLMDVYVVTVDSNGPKLKAGRESNGSPPSARSIDALGTMPLGGTVDNFCQVLEGILGRPVVNETNLQGPFAISLPLEEVFDGAESASQGVPNDFLDRLRDQTGLIVQPAQRNVEMLVFKIATTP